MLSNVLYNIFLASPGGLDSREPWQGEWGRGVQVSCLGDTRIFFPSFFCLQIYHKVFFYQIFSKISFLASKFVANSFDFKNQLCSGPMCLVNLYCLVFLLGHLWSGGSGGLKKICKKGAQVV